MAEYDDKDGSRAQKLLERVEAEIKAKAAKGDDDDSEGIDRGHTVLSADQSAITGESLASDKYIGDNVYYTTGCKRGKVGIRFLYSVTFC